MNPLQNPLEGFAPEFYLAILREVAYADGLQPIEEELLQQQASGLGVDLEDLPQVPQDLSQIPWATRILVYRDALMLANADDKLSPEEVEYLSTLARRLGLSSKITQQIEDWLKSYEEVLDSLVVLLQEPTS